MWEVKNFAEIIILVTYAIAILWKMATVESQLKHAISSNRAKLDLTLAQENGKRSILERDIQGCQRDIENCRYEVSKKLAEISQMQRDIQCSLRTDYTQK
jgi:uncharacterized membrane protein YfbV (UPF0208 family)